MSGYLTMRDLCSTGNYANVFYAYTKPVNKDCAENFIVPRSHNIVNCLHNKCLTRNPKTGGSAMVEALKKSNINVNWGHYTTIDSPNEIVVVRDPFERFKSGINFMRYAHHRNNTKYLLEFDTFVNMMKVTDYNKLFDEVLNKDLVFTPQHNWVGKNSTVLCYEKGIENEFKEKLGQTIKLDQVNTKDNLDTGGGKTPTENEREIYWKDSDAAVKDILNHFYKEDIELYKKYCG